MRQEAAAAWAEVNRFLRDFRSPSRPWVGELPRELERAAGGLTHAAQEVAGAWAQGDLTRAGRLAREALDALAAARDRRRELYRLLQEGQRLREEGEAEASRLEARLAEVGAAVEGVALPAAVQVAAAVARGRDALAALRAALSERLLDVDRAGAALAGARQATEEAQRYKEAMQAELMAELERLRAEYGDNPAWSPIWSAFQAGEGVLSLLMLYQLLQQARALAAGEPVPAGPPVLGDWAPGGPDGDPDGDPESWAGEPGEVVDGEEGGTEEWDADYGEGWTGGEQAGEDEDVV